ncbi:MAG TPA: hypothetical protein VFS33_10980 [Gemmatimonadales bacterium]|nr:hypothetical protein [Gemmatimonadales bacterium]
MSPYAIVCPWCGQNVVVTRLLRLGVFALLVGGMAYGVSSVGLGRLQRMFVGLDEDPITAVDVAARREDPAWARWLERTLGGRRGEAIDRASRILADEPANANGSASDCRVRDTSKVLTLVSRYPELSDAQVHQIACGMVPAGLSRSQLTALFGSPLRTQRQSAEAEEWIYAKFRVRLKDGQVDAVAR